MRLPIVVVLSLGLAACSGDLVVEKQTGVDNTSRPITVPIQGVPFRIAEPYVGIGYLTQHSSKDVADCFYVLSIHTLNLPSKELYYASPKTAWLAKTSFSAKINADGTIQSIDFNSEPSGGDVIKNLTDATVKLAALAGIGATAAAGPGKPAVPGGPTVACNANQVDMKIVPLKDYLSGNYTVPQNPKPPHSAPGQ